MDPQGAFDVLSRLLKPSINIHDTNQKGQNIQIFQDD